MPAPSLLVRLVIATLTLSAAAQAAPPAAAPRSGEAWHVVRPGDTLEGLAARYLGDADRWPELYKLNPGMISDPHWIYPGRRMRVRVERPSAQPNAELVETARRVEQLPAPVAWRDAATGDLLLEQDAVRTHAGSSARLLFDDGTAATLAENSLVFVRRQTPASAPAPRKEIEIELGQAEFETAPGGLPQPEIEVVVGTTRSTTQPGAQGGHSRHRRQGDAAQVMLYRGSGEVQAAAGKVALAEGTGTTVRADGAPSPPEKLLPAPVLLGPANDAALTGKLELRWSEVPGATGYLVELCGDKRCGSVLRRVAGVRGTSHALPQGINRVLYWRITAQSGSGLDGYPSPSRALRPSLLVADQ